MTSDNSRPHADVLIVGGGLSGTLLAVQLLRLPGQRRIVIIESRSELGRGEAYSATQLGHTLNGNAARMSVDPDNAEDLTQWLSEYIAAGGWPESDEQHVPIAELFPPRGIFGLYVQQRLAEAQAQRFGERPTLWRDYVRFVRQTGEPVELFADFIGREARRVDQLDGIASGVDAGEHEGTGVATLSRAQGE